MTAQDQFSDDLVANIPYLRAFARLLVKDHFLAEDVVQDTLVRALASRTQFKPGTNLRGWLTIILRNRYFNLRRRRGFHAEIPMDVELVGGGGSGGQEERLEMRDFERAFVTLPPAQQRALVMVGANGLSYEEAAKLTGCMVGTMKSRVSRARGQLMHLMGRDQPRSPGKAMMA
jgi:RNA polymerase sigma-70 factor (ECF subfamily)